MSTLDIILTEINKVNNRVQELEARKGEILQQSADLFSENGAGVAAELALIDTKLAQAPRQLDTLTRQRDSLELEAALPQTQPLFDELAGEYKRLREYCLYIKECELRLAVAKANKPRVMNSRLPGIRNRITVFVQHLVDKGLPQAVANALRNRVDVGSFYNVRLTWQEEHALQQHIQAEFDSAWSLEKLSDMDVLVNIHAQARMPDFGEQKPFYGEGLTKPPPANDPSNLIASYRANNVSRG